MKKYYIGLDIGTDSVGWAVTDEDYNLLRARGQDMWGSYLFEEAESAAERRQHRTARRNRARARQRLCLLQSLFAEEMSRVDDKFFLRLNNSPLFMEDKDARLHSANVLFDDATYKDKQFFLQYPTIYHLRSELLNSANTDLRKLYLAVHHIIKNRGHFLFDAQTFDVNDEETVRGIFLEINAFLAERDMNTLELSELDDVMRVMRDKKTNKRDKCRILNGLFAVGKNKQQISIVKALTGANANLKELFASENDFDEIKAFSFDKAAFEENDLPSIETAVGEDDAKLVYCLKAAYDWSVLCGIMNNRQYVSEAKVDIYDKHKADLAKLKTYIRNNCGADEYRLVFRHLEKVNNYAAYIGMDRQKGYSKCSRDEFYAFLKKEIGITDESILRDMENGEFLPKQVSNANGVIPYQLNLRELEVILENAKKSFPFLSEVRNGVSVADKIKSLMTFRIPYYVGPLNSASQFAWAVRKDGQERTAVTPWNFDSVIDKDASEHGFIRRMTNKCTYLVGEDVLPACSLLYSEFTFLNELNNLKVNGEKDAESRALVYEYAKTHKRITLKNIVSLLIRQGKLPAGSKAEEVLSGTDGDFKTSLSPWVDLRFLGDRLYTHREMCEEIILWITLISDKSRLEKRIRQKYGKILEDAEIKRLKNFNYSQWGRLSEKLLTGITSPKCADENGELLTLIEAMRSTGENFMQLLSEKYGFQKAIDNYNEENSPSGKITYSTVKELYCSPSVKRAIWRSIELVREITGIYKCAPHKIFVETAREKNDESRKGVRTVSRKQQLLDLYKSIKGDERNWIEEIGLTPDTKFNSDKLFLYYQQMGRSAYSGKALSLNDVFNTNVCDVEHIYPRSKIKDDSLDNKVLVLKTENANKSDVYPISADIRKSMTPFWTALKEKGLISDNKYARLVRNTPLTQEELADFINRQLVSTRQSTKAVIELLKKMLPDTEIVYAKAGNANEFKEKNGIVKIRELNDLHHAKDAYINIVVGNVYNTKFNHNAAVYFKQNGQESYNLKYLFAFDIKGAWKVADKDRILKTTAKNTCRVVRMTAMGKGALFNATVKTAGANDNLIPLKANGAISDTSKYGGYDSATTAYFMLVKSKDKKGQSQLSLEAYPLMWEKRFPDNNEAKIKFCKESAGLIDPEILIREIKLNTLICIDGSYAYLRGKTGDRIVLCNANQLYLDDENVRRLKTVSKYMAERKQFNKPDLLAGRDVTAENNLALYDALLEKLNSPIYSGLALQKQHPFLTEKRDVFAGLSVEQQCRVLFEVLHLMQCNSVASDFSLLGGVSKAGINLTNKIMKDKKVKIILQSPTGYYRKIIDFEQFQ